MMKVNTPVTEYETMRQHWALPDALLGGTYAMRKAGETFLPKHTVEESAVYEKRLSKSVLFPGYGKTLDILVGKPFQQRLALAEDNIFSDWYDNIDLQGTDMHTFFRDVFKDAINRGKSHVLVDYIAGVEDATLADQTAGGFRPYAVHIRADQVIGWQSDVINGIETLTQVRYKYTAPVNSGEYGRKLQEYIRVLRPGSFEDWMETETKWELVSRGEILGAGGKPLNSIPIKTYYTNRTGFMTATPPLEDLAFLNSQHWQSSSDQFNILTWARVPLLFGQNMAPADGEEHDPIQFGPNMMMEGPEASDLKYVEHSGAAITAGAEHNVTLENQMRVIGVEVLVTQRPGNVTATERAIQTAETNSTLKSYVIVFQEYIEQVLSDFGLFDTRATNPGRVDLNTDFGFSLSTATDMATLIQMNQMGNISDETLLREAQRRHILSDDIVPKNELEKAEDNKNIIVKEANIPQPVGSGPGGQ